MIIIQPGDRVVMVAETDDVEVLEASAQAFRQAFPDVECLIVARSWMLAEVDAERLDWVVDQIGGGSQGDALRAVIQAGLSSYEQRVAARPAL